MKISKRTRNAAIEACLCRADEWIAAGGGWPASCGPAGGIAEDALIAAVSATGIDFGDLDGASEWLEAAALLRDGWSPGDPVHLLGGRS